MYERKLILEQDQLKLTWNVKIDKQYKQCNVEKKK